MTQALRYLGPADGYLPQPTGQVIAYIRKESDYAINKYVQMVPTKTPLGVYAILGRDQFVRVVNTYKSAWEDGDPRPSGEWNKVPYQWADFRTFRRTFPWTIGHKALRLTAQYGAWQPQPVHMQMAMSQCMIERVNRVQVLLQASATWPTSNQGSANGINGGLGKWSTASDDPSSPYYEAIYTTLSAAARIVHKQTNGMVKPSELLTIVNPDDAAVISKAPEIVNYMRESPAAREIVERGLDPQYALWGLPQMYKGFTFVVDDTVYVNTNPNINTQTGTVGMVAEASLANPGRQYAWQSGSAVMVSRKGGLDGVAGSPAFSTVQLYHFGGLAEVEGRDNTWDRRVEGSVTEDTAIVVPAAFAGFYITGIV